MRIHEGEWRDDSIRGDRAALPSDRENRRGGDGCGLEGRGHTPASPCRAEIRPGRTDARWECRRPTPARIARRLGAQPPQHLLDLRHRRMGGTTLHCHGIAGGSVAAATHRRSTHGGRGSYRSRDPACRRPRRRPRQGDHPPGHQTGEHRRDRRRNGFSSRQDTRLRSGQAFGRSGVRTRRRRRNPVENGHDPTGCRGRHGLLHVTRTGTRETARPPNRHIFSGSCALRDDHGPQSIRRHRVRGSVRCDFEPGADRPVELNTDVPTELENIVNKALEKDPALRFQSAADMGADLKRLRRDASADQVTGVSSSVARRPRGAGLWRLQRLP